MKLVGLPLAVFIIALVVPAGVVVALYTARLRRKPAVVAFGLLWRKVAERVSQTRKLGRLENPFGLILQLLAIALICFAAGHPRWVFQEQAPLTVALVMDNSGSMAARPGLRSRFDEARSRALSAVDRLADTDRIAVITTGGEVRLVRGFTTLKKSVREALNGLRVVDGPGQLADGVRRAVQLLAAQGEKADLRPLIYVVTDGQEELPPAAELPRGTRLQVELVGDSERLPNVGITAFEVNQRAAAPGRYEAFLEVRNLSSTTAKGQVRLALDGKLVEVRPFQLAAEGRFTQVFSDLAGSETSTMTAELTGLQLGRGQDTLPTDNTAYAVLRRPAINVRLVSEKSLYLPEVLRAQPRLRVTLLTPADFAQLAARAPQLSGVTIIEGSLPPRLPPGSYFLINPVPAAGGDQLFTRIGQVKNPAFTRFRSEHPVLRSVQLAEVAIAQSNTYRLGPGSTVLAGTQDEALLWAQEDRGRRVVGLAFAPSESNLPLRVAFPVLVYNTLTWLGETRVGATTLTPGKRFAIDVADATAARAVVRHPDGTERTLAAVGGTLQLVGDKVGLYLVRAAGDTRVAANLFSASESALGQRPVPPGWTSGGLSRTNSETWPFFVVLGILILLLEWQLYHRRVTQ
jgi:hypothetical protein